MDADGLRKRSVHPVDDDGDDSDAEAVRQQLLSQWLGIDKPAQPADVPLPESAAGTRPSTPSRSDETPPQCRICFTGSSPGDEADPEVGRLISPCKCRGTMAYIHIGCLQQWRRMAANSRSFWQCDQCGYKYRVRRAGVAGLAENKLALGSCTMFIFILLIILSGYIAGWILETTSLVPELEPEEGWTTWPMSAYTYDGRLVGDAVGEAVRVLNNKLHVDLESMAAQESEDKSLDEDIGDTAYRYFKPRRQSGEHLHVSRSSQNGHSDAIIIPKWVPPSAVNKVQAWIEHSIMGLAFIGLVSFGQFIISMTFFTPFNFGVRNSMFRLIRGNRRDGEAGGLGSGLILLLIVVGIIKAIHSVWKGVRGISRYLLRYVEERVLDVRE